MSRDAWLQVLAAAPIGSRGWSQALRAAGGADALLGMSLAGLHSVGLDSTESRRLRSIDAGRVSAWHRWLEQPGHHLVTLASSAYPDCLAELGDAPLALWVAGSAPAAIADPQVAIVGSRHPSAGGRVTATRFAEALSRSGISVTSGLAIGIDAASHEGGLRGPGRTIAVLGSGIDTVYPARHEALAARIAETGALVSEYPPGTPTRAHQFPRRNRIIAGLSLGTLVVEAARRSGSLITARHALEHGREVFAVPGSIHSALSKGCHQLLREGARLVEEVDDILVELAPALRATLGPGDRPKRSESGPEAHDPGRRRLLDLLDFSPVTIAQLMPGTGLTAAELSSMLLHLEIEGQIEALPGGRYCRQVKRG